jgi:pentatricopeptide repeat protein
MSLLRKFLTKCTGQELYRLKLLDFRGNEYQTLHETIRHCHNPKVSDEQIRQKLNLSKTYFDKINSVLLNKCSAALTSKGTYEEVFALLQSKDLCDILKHEIKVREKKICKSNQPDEIERFYTVCFQTLRRLPVTEYDDALTESYMLKYLKHKSPLTIEDQIEAYAMLETQRVFVMAINGQMKSYEPKFLKKMKQYYAKIAHRPFHRAHFHYHLAMANYLDYYTTNYPALVAELKSAIHHYEMAKTHIDETYRIYVITKLAKAYCQGNNFEEAFKIYQEAFDLFGEKIAKHPYHPTMYAVIAIINGKYQEAEKMMNEHLQHLLQPQHPGTIDFDIYRTYAILYMNQSKFDLAAQYLQKAFTFKRSDVSLLGEILLRMVHNAFFVLSGDILTAKAVLARNLKFLRSKQSDAMVQEYMGFFKILEQIIRYRCGKKLPGEFHMQLRPYREGIMKLYGDLLYKMID